jgi:hypothetical protein
MTAGSGFVCLSLGISIAHCLSDEASNPIRAGKDIRDAGSVIDP